MRKPMLATLLISTLLLTGCVQSATTTINIRQAHAAAAGEGLTHPAGSAEYLSAESSGGLSTWAVYWDTEQIVPELAKLEDLRALYYFETFFDSDDTLFLPPEVMQMTADVHAAYPNADWKSYLTFVNDYRRDNLEIIQKDTKVLHRVLKDAASRRAHINEIVRIAVDNGFDGIEIDYEYLRDDMELWALFLPFCEELYARASDVGLGVRVILESTTPFEKLQFPQGPVYAVMCYNLYGLHSGPGPKADRKFLKQIAGDAATLPGKLEFAFATGGFDWSSKGAEALTEAQALALLQRTGQKPRRDADSYCQVFTYTETGDVHTVWYADGETLAFWRAVLAESGMYGTGIWRLGGNVSLDRLNHV